MATTPKTPLALLAEAADEMHALTDRLTDAAEELLREPTPAPLVLAAVDEAVEAVRQSMRDGGWTYRTTAQAVLDLIAARMPVWQPVEPGTVIKAGTHYRVEWYPEADDEPTTAADALRATMEGRCLSGITHRDEEHRQSVCMLPEGHAPLAHDDCMGCTWTDATTYATRRDTKK